MMMNMSATNISQERMTYTLHPTSKGITIFAFVAILMASTVGHCSVFLVVYRRFKSNSLKNYYLLILNLSLADLATAWSKIPLEIALLTDGITITSTNGCRFFYVFLNTTYYTSVFTLVAISIQRYRAILYPLSIQVGLKGTLYICCFIWLISIAIRIPFLHVYHFMESTGRCIFDLDPHAHRIIKISLVFISFILPFAVVAFAYVRISRRVARRHVNSSKTAEKKMAETRKVVWMLIFATTGFLACVAPFQIFGLLAEFIDMTHVPNIMGIATATQVIAVCHCAVNPIAYTLGNNLFRKEVKQACSCHNNHDDNNDTQDQTLKM